MQQLIDTIHWLSLLGLLFYGAWALLDLWRMAFWETTALLGEETRDRIKLYRDAHRLFPWKSIGYAAACLIVFFNTGGAA